MPDGDSLRTRSVTAGRGRGALTVDVVPAPGLPARGLAAWLRRAAPATARGSVTVALVSDLRVRTLNRQYRNADSSTDVLSFPGDDPDGYLGDVVIATGVARRQARAARHSVLTELKVLSLHGLLHLLGYDHERDGGRMARVEQRLRRGSGLREGLIERAHANRDANGAGRHVNRTAR